MMVTVAATFQDKFTGAHHHPGDVINVGDKARIARLEELGLITGAAVDKPMTPKKAATKKKSGV